MQTETITELEIDTLRFPGSVDEEPIEELSSAEVIPKKNPKHYVDNKALSAAMKEWKAAWNLAKAEGKEPPAVGEFGAVGEFIGKCILDIATNMANKFNFRRYSYKDEMIADACLNVLTYIHNFNPFAPTRSGEPNAFWYISMTCHNAFTKRILSEHRQQYYKYKSFEMLASMSDMLGDEDLAEHQESGTQSIQEMYNDFLGKASAYEQKYAKKNKKDNSEESVPEEKPGSLSEFME